MENLRSNSENSRAPDFAGSLADRITKQKKGEIRQTLQKAVT